MSELIIFKGLEIAIEVDSYSGGDPGIVHLAPEDCYPPEPAEIEWHVDDDQEGYEFINEAICEYSDWSEQVTNLLLENYTPEEPEPQEPDENF